MIQRVAKNDFGRSNERHSESSKKLDELQFKTDLDFKSWRQMQAKTNDYRVSWNEIAAKYKWKWPWNDETQQELEAKLITSKESGSPWKRAANRRWRKRREGKWKPRGRSKHKMTVRLTFWSKFNHVERIVSIFRVQTSISYIEIDLRWRIVQERIGKGKRTCAKVLRHKSRWNYWCGNADTKTKWSHDRTKQRSGWTEKIANRRLRRHGHDRQSVSFKLSTNIGLSVTVRQTCVVAAREEEQPFAWYRQCCSWSIRIRLSWHSFRHPLIFCSCFDSINFLFRQSPVAVSLLVWAETKVAGNKFTVTFRFRFIALLIRLDRFHFHWSSLTFTFVQVCNAFLVRSDRLLRIRSAHSNNFCIFQHMFEF